MSKHPHEGMPGGSVPTEKKFPPEGEIIAIPQAPRASFDFLEVLPSALANTSPPPLTCPASGCPLILKGEMPHRYLKRHLKHPGLYGRTGDEKETWLNLHKIEYERLLAALEDNKAEEEKQSRAAEFELRAKSMGITEAKLVAQKVAIWEGMFAARQNDDDIGVSALYSALFRRL
ncbi:hypothetical protein B9Z19DRAFT_1136613 [Tuber borchii]|uniref:Uncharacterized protein n=1 Tax=Tuber borchii TaxID=42251 RepID=A0A2T6ZBF6_TUBBO|nr:hypothetical protein B9Z19DRAFT_1136613 [Tuber borchii]